MAGPDNPQVTAFRLTSTVAKARVRELAADSKNLVWTDHIEERMFSRGIDTDTVLRILRDGDVETDPLPAKGQGDWKIKLTRLTRTGRVAGVVTVLVSNQRLILLTAEWEDHR